MKNLIILASVNIGASAIAGLLIFGIIALVRYVSTKKEMDARAQGEGLMNLKEQGILTEAEYESKIDALVEIELDKQIKKSAEYKLLEKLKKQGVLTNSEFAQKVLEHKNNVKRIVQENEDKQQ